MKKEATDYCDSNNPSKDLKLCMWKRHYARTEGRNKYSCKSMTGTLARVPVVIPPRIGVWVKLDLVDVWGELSASLNVCVPINRPCWRVEDLERQHQVRIPQSCSSVCMCQASTLTVNCASLSISLGEERGGGGGHTHTRIMRWIVKSLNKSGMQEKVDFSNH